MKKVALIGAGGIASVAWAPNLGYRDDVEFLVFDQDTAKAGDLVERFGGTAFDSLAEMLAQQPEIVIIATPPLTHTAVALTVLSECEGLRFLVIEKPLARNLVEAMDIMDVARAKNVEVFVPCHQLLEAEGVIGLVASGEYGAVLNLAYTWARRSGSPHGRPRSDVGSHFFAFWKALRGWAAPGQVSAAQVGSADRLQVAEDGAVASAWLKFEDDLPVSEVVRVTVVCERAILSFALRTAQTPDDDPNYRVSVLPLGGAAQKLGDEYDVLPAERARELQVERLLSGQGLPVGGLRALSIQAHEDAACEAERVPGTWVSPHAVSISTEPQPQ